MSSEEKILSMLLRGDPEVMRCFAAAKKNVDTLYIAAISIVNGCTLITTKVKRFSRFEGLNFVNWHK